MTSRIAHIHAREILGATGRPAVEVMMTLENGMSAMASVPSGTSRGGHEAFELLDGETRFHGYGVRKAVANVQAEIFSSIKGMDVLNQANLDHALLKLDGTPDKHRLGANAILPVSIAAAKVAALFTGQSVYRYLGGQGVTRLPMPIATVIAGGEYSPSTLAFEDFLYIVEDFSSFHEALEALAETRAVLGAMLTERYGTLAEVGGALAPPLRSTEEAFDAMLEACEKAGYGGKMALALDVAATELYRQEDQTYQLGENRIGTDALLELYCSLAKAYPLRFIEDPFHEDDFASHASLLEKLLRIDPCCSVVGDDLFATNPERLAYGIKCRAATEMLFKINQIGTVTEALLAASIASENGLALTLSLRSNDTGDDFVADLAVAIGAKRFKAGSPVRAERNAKYNRLLAIEEELGRTARFSGGNPTAQ
jgi:enolase